MNAKIYEEGLQKKCTEERPLKRNLHLFNCSHSWMFFVKQEITRMLRYNATVKSELKRNAICDLNIEKKAKCISVFR